MCLLFFYYHCSLYFVDCCGCNLAWFLFFQREQPVMLAKLRLPELSKCSQELWHLTWIGFALNGANVCTVHSKQLLHFVFHMEGWTWQCACLILICWSVLPRFVCISVLVVKVPLISSAEDIKRTCRSASDVIKGSLNCHHTRLNLTRHVLDAWHA